MVFALLADLIVVLHFSFVLFVIFGGFAVLRQPRVAWLHLPAVAWGAAVEMAGWICPLTPWEIRLRALAGSAGYAGGFIDHYLVPLIYPPGLTRELQIGLGVAVAAINLAIYLWVWRRTATSSRG